MKPILLILTIFILSACGGGKKQAEGALTDKQLELEKLKKEQVSISEKIVLLEKELAALNPSKEQDKVKLVGVTVIESQDFAHYIDLQGKITTENIYTVAPRGYGRTGQSHLRKTR